MKKILLLGSGELGKEFVISAQRKGQHVIACDSYAGAPAMQVADEFEVFDMLDGEALERVVEKHHPDIIVPEIEAIRTERLYDFEKEGIQVVPSARAVNFTMNRKAIRDLAAKELGLKTANYFYAKTLDELKEAAAKIGFPCVVKPLMSSSGKGQSLVKSADELEHAWEYGCSGSRGDIRELIIEEFIKFDSEITLLTVTQKNGPTLFCPPIGHVQKGGDYRESFQPAHIDPAHLKEAEEMAEKVTRALTGAGLWGVEFFLSRTRSAHPRHQAGADRCKCRYPFSDSESGTSSISWHGRSDERRRHLSAHLRQAVYPRQPSHGSRTLLCTAELRSGCVA